MGKKKNLNGLPNSLTQRYFSTLFYYSKAYMSDWILNAASEIKISELVIDLMNETIEPKEMEIKPILAYLPRLKETIYLTLENENFESDFINSGIFKIELSKKYNFLNCTAILTDKEGKEYIGKTYTEFSYEKKFKVFKPNIIERIKNML
ncbi:hypothetical protein [uncultured Dokdonia sp.]|uniref:hypothetical protein n=1 Tax=uncultured Dokdonia sp. TaxID=575653 RepID=UPI002638EA83|nr:hypothetical protein [uncultured Dokdonia sp.]